MKFDQLNNIKMAAFKEFSRNGTSYIMATLLSWNEF
jgi:hypothetical protein